MMNGFDNGMSAGGWLLMSVFLVALIALIVWVVADLGNREPGRAAGRSEPESPDETLDRRLAAGEVDPATYDVLRAKLGEARASRRHSG